MVKGNTFAATAFFSYGAFWMAWYVAQFVVKTAAVAGTAVPAFSGAKTFPIGETLIMVLWGVFTFLFWIPTLRKNGCLCTVFGTLWVTFLLLAGGQWSAACGQAAGYIGFVCGCSAIYTAFAEVGVGLEVCNMIYNNCVRDLMEVALHACLSGMRVSAAAHVLQDSCSAASVLSDDFCCLRQPELAS